MKTISVNQFEDNKLVGQEVFIVDNTTSFSFKALGKGITNTDQGWGVFLANAGVSEPVKFFTSKDPVAAHATMEIVLQWLDNGEGPEMLRLCSGALHPDSST